MYCQNRRRRLNPPSLPETKRSSIKIPRCELKKSLAALRQGLRGETMKRNLTILPMKLEENNPLMEVLASRGRRTGGSYTPGSACFRVL
jgi:hypothetical protein